MIKEWTIEDLIKQLEAIKAKQGNIPVVIKVRGEQEEDSYQPYDQYFEFEVWGYPEKKFLVL